ncbi:MAG: ribonuclease HII [bacterium]
MLRAANKEPIMFLLDISSDDQKDVRVNNVKLETFQFDRQFRQREEKLLAGIDEAGRGSLAGPVVAACVILPPNFNSKKIKDSKMMTSEEREEASMEIKKKAILYSISYADHMEIDRYNILQATYLAMKRAFSSLRFKPDTLLIDGPRAPIFCSKQHCVIDGDKKSLTIGAASILAKVFRDRFMKKYHRFYPKYGFDKHKGYFTALHRETLKLYGPCPIHRVSFSPIRELCFSEAELL